ncbi:MAG: radical SAM protein [Candidatus Scalindua sp.]
MNKSVFNILRLTNKMLVLPVLVMYPSSACNYKCVMCDLIKEKPLRKKEDIDFLDLGLVKKIILQAKRFNPFFLPRTRIHFSGLGDPLVYPKMNEVMKFCKKKNIKWSMTTNGFLLERYAEQIVKNKCFFVNISIHGLEKIHEDITLVKGSYKKQVEGIKRLSSLKKKYGTKFPKITLNCAISNLNIETLKEIVKEMSQLAIHGISFQHLMYNRPDLKSNSKVAITDKKKLEQLASFVKLSSKWRKVDFFPVIHKEEIEGYYTDYDFGFNNSCNFPWLALRAYPNGDIGNCNVSFGNIKQDSLKRISNNANAVNFRNKAKKWKVGDMCLRCCHRQYY